MFHNSHIKKIIISGLLLGLIFQSSISFAVATNPLPNPYPEELLKHNTNVLYENERFSLFLVLSRLSLEELQEMLQECLAMAFRTEGEFKMSTTTLSATIDQSFKDGLSNFLAEYLSPGSDDYAEAFYKKLKDEINEKYETCTSTEAERPDCIQKCVNQEGISETECARKCRKTSKAISDLLADFLTADLRSKLPSEIQKILNERLRDVIFSDKVNAILSTSTLAVLNKALGEALNKTIVDEVPALKETLGRKVTSYMAPSLVKPLEKIDRLLSFKIEDLKTYIDNKIASTTATMAAKLKEAVTKTKNTANAGTNLDRAGCCNIAYFRGEHWYWSFTTRTCTFASRDNITNTVNWNTIKLGIRDCGTKDTNIIPGETMSPPQNQIDFCEMSSDSCWQNSVCAQCDKAETWKEMADIRGWWSSFTKNLFTALLAMPQQIMLAMIDVAAHTLTEYAQVWVEDELIAPLQPYFNKFAEFQKKLHKALNYTVADLLPKQANVLLTSNADQILDMICKGAQKGGIDIGSEEEEIKKNREAACNTYKELHQDLLSQLADTGHLGKEIKDALNSAVFDLLPSNLQQLLASSTAELLWPEITNIKKLILGTPKQIICGELFNKNFEVKIDDTNSSVFEKCTTAGPIGLRTTQGTIGLLPYIDKTSTFWTGLNSGLKEKYAISCPIIWYVCQNPLSPWSAKVGDVLVNIISSQCASIDKKTANKCNWSNYDMPAQANLPNEFKPGCAACKTLNSSLAFSLFRYGMEEAYGAATTTGLVTAQTCANIGQNFDCKNKNTATKIFQCKCQERAAYQWLYVAFPLLRDSSGVTNFNGGTKQVAVVARGFKEAEWDDNVPNSTSSIVQEIKYYSGTSELPPSATALAQTFITWMTNEASGKEILTSIPLGVIKPFTLGEATLLRDAGKGSKNEEFLAYMPYEFLEQELCRKVIADFKKDYSTSTIEAIMATEANKLAQISGIPYSVESLRHTTMAQAEQILLSNDEIDAERKASYLTCFALDKKPAALFGLDQKLIEYVRPEPYKVLFTLIKEKLKEDERPTLLNKLLVYLYTWNPVQLACVILTNSDYDTDEQNIIDNASSTPAEIAAAQKRLDGKAGAIDLVCNLLGTTMGERIKTHLPNKAMICLIAEQLVIDSDAIIASSTASLIQKQGAEKIKAIANNCFAKQLSRDDWAALQLFLRKSPLQLIKDYLTQKLLDNDLVNAPPVMDYIASHTVLGQPYIDTLGRWLHLDDDIQTLFLDMDKFSAAVDKATLSVVAKIKDTFDKIILEYPKAVYDWLLRSLGVNMGKGMGQDAADKIAGHCWQTTESECISGSNTTNVYNISTGECCNMGAGLVCVPRCRKAATTPVTVNGVTEIRIETCKAFEGEASTTIPAQPSQPYCCFEKIGNVCDACRKASSEEATKTTCLRDKNNETYHSTTIVANNTYDSNTFNVCCRKRELKEYNKPDDKTCHMCCINVLQCVSDKFIFFLQMFSDAMLHGPLLERLK